MDGASGDRPGRVSGGPAPRIERRTCDRRPGYDVGVHQGAAMKKVLFATGLVVSCLRVFVASPAAQAPMPHAECSHLTMIRFPDVKIATATSVPAATTGAIRAAHCRVDGTI